MLFSPPLNTFLPWKSTVSWARFAPYRNRPFGCTWTVPAAWRDRRVGGPARVSARKAISALIRPASILYVYILFWVSIETYIQGFVGWKSRCRGPKFLPPSGAIDTALVSTPFLYSKALSALGSSALLEV